MTLRLARRAVLHFVLLTCVISLISCDRPSVAGKAPITIRFWNGFTGPDGRAMLAMIKKFNDANPDVYVNMQRMDWGLYYNKLFVAGLGDRAPEVFAVHVDTLARFTRASFVRPVDDLMGTSADSIADPNDIDENVWRATERDGKHWGVPLDIHLLGTFYNRELFRKAKIVDASGAPKPPMTRDEFVDALKKLRGVNGADTWGFVYTWLRTNSYTVIRQNGGDIFNADRTKCIVDSPENCEALQWCADLVKQQLVPSPQNFEAWTGFRQGKVGIAWEGIYMLPDLKKQTDLDYAAAPVPLLFKKPAAWANSHSICFRAHLTGEELAAAKKFVKFLSDNSLDWADAGQIPVRKSLRTSERFQGMTIQREFAKQIPYAAYFPAVPYNLEYINQWDQAVELILRGTETPQKALGRARVNIEKIMKRYGSTPLTTGGVEVPATGGAS
jgi:multiple sugar transport system substrate-binding protein